ncbi:hypothetical protein CUS_4847 [Ruminococcus albus 8]|uniref:Uncharacterized protein n=1 Tax=Ruminococcus albus 8 TaxID=246199 RepID=E9S8E3_RUMAL|nr:hypothetical protein CUS_4847 [Ruminococcus albus 8]
MIACFYKIFKICPRFLTFLKHLFSAERGIKNAVDFRPPRCCLSV